MYVNTLDIDTRNRDNWSRMTKSIHDHLVKCRRVVAAAEASTAADELPSPQ